MSTTTTSSNSVTSVGETVPSLADLLQGDVPQLLAWIKSKHFIMIKLDFVLTVATINDRTDVCLAIIDSGLVSSNLLAKTLQVACHYNQLTTAKVVFERYQTLFEFQDLYLALLGASSFGHSEVVQWLLGEMKLSHDDSVTWLLATASARGDIDTVKLLTAQTVSQAIHDTSHALRCACYNGRGNVVDWLMANTASSANKVGHLGVRFRGTMTSLIAACFNGHTDFGKTLLQCVTPHTVNIQCGKFNESALHYSIWCARASGDSRLHRACTNNIIERATSFLYTDYVDLQNNGGETPLHCACVYGSMYIVQCLLSVFANTNIIDDAKRTPLEQAKFCDNNEVVPCFSQLLPRRADTTTNVTTSVSVTQSTSGIASITDVTISDVHSRQQHERKRVSVHNTVKQRHKIYV